MKSISEYYYDIASDKYLNEGLLSWVKAFFKKIRKSQETKIQDNKVEMYTVDTKKIKVQKEPAKLVELDKDTIDFWSDKKIGYPIASLIYKNQQRYLVDGDNKFDPLFYCYFSPDGNNMYSIGLIMYDDNVSFIDSYKHIIDVESNLIVDNPTDVNKMIIKQFGDTIKKQNSNIKGFTAKAIHPKLKGNLIGIGFKPSNFNKEIFIYNI